VLAQTYPEVELIVVDDVRLTARPKSCNAWRRAFRTHHPESTRTAPAPLSHATRHSPTANGNYIAFLDADDMWHPTRYALMHDALHQRKNAALLMRLGKTSASQQRTPHPKIPPIFVPGEASNAFWKRSVANQQRADPPSPHRRSAGFERAPTGWTYEPWLRCSLASPGLSCTRCSGVLSPLPTGRSHIPYWQKVFDAVAVRRDFAAIIPSSLPASRPPASMN